MELGFETIGNATVIAFDKKPLLVTDPWIAGPAYFGSWCLPHEIPLPQMESIKRCEYVWLSHGHPDHAHSASLELLADKKFLLPDHYHARMCRELRDQGFSVEVLPDRKWKQLSPRVRVLCIADYNQDAILLIDIGGVLFVNLNDASDCGWGQFVSKVAAEFKLSFLAALPPIGAGADMMNLFTEERHRIEQIPIAKLQPGLDIALRAERYGVRFSIPFSSMHQYQRQDSVWANPHVANLEDLKRGFSSKTVEQLPAYIQYNCHAEKLEELSPAAVPLKVHEPEEFDDSWSDILDATEQKKINDYFQPISHLSEVFSHITFRVGGKDSTVDLGGTSKKRAIMFEAPRQSLMTAIEWNVFDDLLIGNFMKTTLIGNWGTEKKSLYPDFSPFVAKYADNGGAKTTDELREYFRSYRQRDAMGYMRHYLTKRAGNALQNTVASQFRSRVARDSRVYGAVKRAYHFLISMR